MAFECTRILANCRWVFRSLVIRCEADWKQHVVIVSSKARESFEAP